MTAVIEVDGGWIPDYEDSFADRLKAVRDKTGLGQIEFGDAIGASHASISQWERGTMPRDMVALAQKIHEEFGADIKWLIGLEKRPAVCSECGDRSGYCHHDAPITTAA